MKVQLLNQLQIITQTQVKQSINMRNSVESLQHKSITIQPAYLLKISTYVEIISKFYQNEGLQPLTIDFKKHLQGIFSVLGQSLYQWAKNPTLTQSAVLKSKIQIQSFCWVKLFTFLNREAREVGGLIEQLHNLSREHYEDYQKIVIQERKNRLNQTQDQKDNFIGKLKKEVNIQKDHIRDLQVRIRQVENENSNLFSKMIQNAKSTIDQNLNSSKPKTLLTSKIKDTFNQVTPKTLFLKQVEESILEIMEAKFKQQSLKGRRVSMNTFLSTYFRNKFGMKELAEQAQNNFRQALDFFAKSQQKHLILLFVSILREECEEAYFQQSKVIYQKITKFLKRYLNSKHGTSLDDLNLVYDQRLIQQKNDYNLNQSDIHYVLSNLYGIDEVDSLQSIFSEIMVSRGHSEITEYLVPSKKIINEILNYQLRKHNFNVEDIIRVIKEVDSEKKGVLSYSDLERIAVRLDLSSEKLGLLLQSQEELQDRFLTVSEVIQFIQRIKRTKIKKNY